MRTDEVGAGPVTGRDATGDNVGRTPEGATWDLVYRPAKIRWIVAGAIVVVLAIHITFGALLNISDTGVTVRLSDQLGLISIGIVIACLLLLFLRSRLRVGPEGVGVRNMVSERFYRWDEVVGLEYPEKAQFARLLLPHDEHIPVMAVQARDGHEAVEAMREFRTLRDRYARR